MSLMKGKKWSDYSDKIEYPVFVEPKVDEIRCEVIVSPEGVQFLSFAGKPLANMQTFAPKFVALAAKTGYSVFDCGIEVNANFNDSYRWVRSTKGIPDDLNLDMVRIILFDLPEHTASYWYRLGSIFDAAVNGGLQYLKHTVCNSTEEVQAAYSALREQGYEGAMIKDPKHTYEPGKRIEGWLKLKNSDTYDGKIVKFYEAHASRDFPEKGIKQGDPLGRIGSIGVVLEDGSEAAPSGIAHELGVDMYLHPDKYMGTWVEFEAMEIDRQGGYRHPVYRRLREAK